MSRQVALGRDARRSAAAAFAAAVAFAAFPWSAAGADLSAADKDRVDRLEGFAKAIAEVAVDRDAGAPVREVDGRQAGSMSELHVRLLTAVAGFENGDKDGVVIFPFQASGYTFTADPRKPEPDRTIGSDFKEARVVIAGLVGADRPRARIDLPQFEHGSTFDAWTLVHDEIQSLVEGWFPEAEIEGRRRLWEKEFEVRNETDETLTVRLFHHTQVHDPKTRAFAWVWKPAPPPAGQPLEFTVNPGATIRVSGTSGERRAITAGSVCVWAAGEGGSRWEEHRTVPLELVAPDPAFGGQRLYHAERPDVYTHVIRPLPGPRVFAERVLEFANETAEPLRVRLRYYTGSDGGFAWQTREFALEPGQSLRPQDAAGLNLRAAAIVVGAESPNLRFGGESDEPLLLVAEAGGRRAYKADRIGVHRHVFRSPAAAGAGRTAVVSAAGVPVQDGTKVVGTASRGQSFRIEETNGDWVRVTLPAAAGGKTGWIQRRHLDVRESRPRAEPAGATRQSVTVARDGVDLKVGSHAILRLERGQRFEVLEERDGWYRVAVSTPAGVRQGWVQRQQVSVVPESRP